MLTELQKSPTSFFWEGLMPSVKAQMEQRGRELDNWDPLVEIVIDSLQPPSILR